ncbi:MAG: DctP family TRAP transporter solute-binding subunit [Geminicoccaceae bacterium]|nr:DctP family TRAP transporter solute-binding subunit [Geminicoccaceae bacterium]
MLEKILRTVSVAAALAMILPAAVRAEAEFTMKVAIANPILDMHHSWTPHLVLKNEIESRSNGRIAVELYPGGQLGPVESTVNQVRQGIIQATDASEGHFATTYPPVQVFSIPYLFLSRDIAWEVVDGPFGQELIDDMAATTGIRPLHWTENGGFRHYSNNVRPIRTPADMVGLKMRTMNIPLHMEIVSNLGASPTPIAWAELYTSLQTGVVDGQENAIATFLIPKLEEVQDYMVLDGHVYSVNTLLLNEAWYQSLPDDLKAVVQQAGRIARTVNRGLTTSTEIMGLEYLKENGVEVYAPTVEEKRLFQEATQEPAIAWLKEQIDPKWVDGMLEATAEAEKELGYN